MFDYLRDVLAILVLDNAQILYMYVLLLMYP